MIPPYTDCSAKNDYYLRANTKEELISALHACGWWSDGALAPASLIASSDDYSISVPGTLYTGPVIGGCIGVKLSSNPDVWGISLTVATPAVAASGYHVNVRMLEGELPKELQPFVISTPSMPIRVWS